MDIQNNSIVTDADTDVLDSQITQISNDFAETYYFDNEQQEELEMLVAKCMKLGELYERKKWQAAKAQTVPECTWSRNEDYYFDTSCGNNFMFTECEDKPSEHQFKHCCYCGGKLIEAQEPTND